APYASTGTDSVLLLDVTIEHARNNYSTFENVWINYEDFAHVIEIYNFPAIFKTEDLVDAFAEFSEGGMKIKWVDNTHALGVFSCKTAASHALSIQHPLLNTRALSKGSKKAKAKAFRHSEFIQPVKERPRTDTAVARRMVTRALGIQFQKSTDMRLLSAMKMFKRNLPIYFMINMY
uniref:Uncharacterized protein n=1 Tax=Denticeps clupeoides TaxID=299321 RepID=A0AAY4AGD6_9TELE